MGDHGDVERVPSTGIAADGRHRQTDAVEGDRALLDHERSEGGRQSEGELDGAVIGRRWVEEPPLEQWDGRIDVAEDDMAAKPRRGGQWTFEVDPVTDGECAEVGAPERLGNRVRGPPVVAPFDHRQTGAVHCDRRAHGHVVEHDRGSDHEAFARADRVAVANVAKFLDDAGEHCGASSGPRGPGQRAQHG